MLENRKEKIKVLHVLGSMNMGGIQMFLMNILRNMDHDKVEFDFACMSRSSIFKEEIESFGGHLYGIGSHKKVLQHKKKLYEVLRNHNYDYVHIHSGNALCVIDAIWTKLYNKKQKVIYHSHNAFSKDLWLHRLCKPIIPLCSDYMFACSKEAAEWMYPAYITKNEKYTTITNGIDVKKYLYSEKIAEEVRAELGLKDEFVICHIGRIAKQKNHKFLLQIFMKVLEKRPNSKLLLVGDGPLAEEIRMMVQNLKLQDHVMFLGIRNDVERILCASDVFCLPSLFEGLGIVNLEAQASGLPCYITDSISNEVVITSLVKKESLESSAEVWAERICCSNTSDRKSYNQEVERSRYSLTYTISQICNFYDANM